MGYVLAAIGIVIVAFIGWRWTSVGRGARQRDAKLLKALDPLAERLGRKEAITPDEVAALTRQPQYRPMLYEMLKYVERLDLFPPEDRSIVSQGEGILCYWLMHPNEFQDAPRSIELVEEVERPIGKERVRFLVFRFQMPPGHWAEKDGWLLGLAGPFSGDAIPYSGAASGFSRCSDKFGEIKPADLVDGYIEILAPRAPS